MRKSAKLSTRALSFEIIATSSKYKKVALYLEVVEVHGFPRIDRSVLGEAPPADGTLDSLTSLPQFGSNRRRLNSDIHLILIDSANLRRKLSSRPGEWPRPRLPTITFVQGSLRDFGRHAQFFTYLKGFVMSHSGIKSRIRAIAIVHNLIAIGTIPAHLVPWGFKRSSGFPTCPNTFA